MINWAGVSYKARYKWKQFTQQVQSFRFRVQDLLVFYLPSEKIRDLPKTQALPLGLLSILLLGFCAVSLLVLTYERLKTTTFLALSEDSASVCEELLRNIDNDYYSDSNGYWHGNQNYSYGKALYVYSAQIKRTVEEYREMATYLENVVLGAVGSYMAVNNLGLNLLLLMTFQTTFTQDDNAFETDTFRFTTTPSDVFNTGVYSASAGTMEGICDVAPIVAFDRANHKFDITFNHTLFANSTSCMNAFEPAHLGYEAIWSGDEFLISIDVNTLATVTAVNLRLLPDNSFEEVSENPRAETYGEKGYFFTQFEGMEAFYCFQYDDNPDNYNCYLKVGQVFVLPFFNHAGYNHSEPSYCECDDEEWRASAECNLFHFLAGFIFYDFDDGTETASTSVDRIKDLTFNRSMTPLEINRYAYDISFDVNNPISVTRGNQTWRTKHYQFCKSSDGKFCSIVSLYKYSTSSSVSSYHFQVFDGSCNDFVSLNEESVKRLVETPPTDLVEPYVKCRRTVLSAMQDTLGIVSGNVTAMSPLLLLAVFYIYYFGYIKLKGVKQDVTYSKAELEAISKFFTFNLALARDGMHPTQLRAKVAADDGAKDDNQAILESSIILQLLEELRQVESFKRFHAPLKSESDEEDDIERDSRSEKSSGTEWNSNPMTAGRDEYPNSVNSRASVGIEMSDVDVAKAKRTRKRRKKKKPVRTDPNTLLNPLVYRLDY